MRKLLFDSNNVTAFSPQLSPSPSPLQSADYFNFLAPISSNADTDSFYTYFLPPGLSVAGDSNFEMATFSIITLLIILSIFSLLFIFHLKLKSRSGSHHLQNFSSAWSVRLLLVIFVSFWAFNEILRLPIYRQIYINRPLNLPEQALLCKYYVVFSLGLFEPGILATFLFLVRISVKQRMSAKTSVGSMCLPVLLLQIFVVFFSPLQAQLPDIFYRSSVISKDMNGYKNVVLCTYPLSSTIVFTGFGMLYTLGLSLSCWKLLSVVINKSITNRINSLAFTIMTAIPLQSVCLALSSLCSPSNALFGGVIIVVFLCTAVSAMVGLCILVIKPTADALTAAELEWNLKPEKSTREGEDRKQ